MFRHYLFYGNEVKLAKICYLCVKKAPIFHAFSGAFIKIRINVKKTIALDCCVCHNGDNVASFTINAKIHIH